MNQSYFPIQSESHKNLPIHVATLGIYYEETGITRDNGFPNHQWIQCASGEGVLVFNGNRIFIKRGQGMFIDKNEKHAYYPIEKPWRTHWFGLDGFGLDAMLGQCGLLQTHVRYIQNVDMFEKKFECMMDTAKKSGPFRPMKLSSLAYEMLVMIAEKTNAETDTVSNYTQLAPILKYIEKNYSQIITMDEMAACIQASPQYVCALFKKQVNKRPMEYINHLRISKSKELLIQNRHTPIKQVAMQVGFDSPSYYGKLFLQYEKVTPKAFRQLFLEY